MSFFCTDCGCLFDEHQDICPECGFDLQKAKELNDKIVDRMLRNLKRQNTETDRLIEIRKDRIKEEQEAIKLLEQKKQDRTDRLAVSLEGFIKEMIDKKLTNKTKTQQSYKLVEGTISLTLPTTKIEKGEVDLNNKSLEKYRKIKEELDWANLKKELVVQDGKLYKDGKEFKVDGIEVVEIPQQVKIKL